MKTTKRFEFKYIISYAEYFRIKNALASILVHDQHGEDEDYPVHSVYLDDIAYTGATDKAFGNEVHKKYRIRFYDDESKKKLELKNKVGDESTKYSTPINNELYQAILDQDVDVIEEYLDDHLVRKYLLDLVRFNLKPTATIKYKREAYKDEIDNLRVTFDHTLRSNLFDENDFDADISLLSSNKMVMEIKYEHYLPKSIKLIINKIKPTQIAYSKYFLGYMSLGL